MPAPPANHGGGCFGCFGRRRQSEAFLQAVREGAVSSIATVIEQQPDLAKSTTMLDKKNALHLACEEGHVVVLNAVLEVLTCQESVRTDESESINSILNAQDSCGQTPLFVAAALGHSDCVRLLLTNGADRKIPDIRGNLPLHMSSWWGHLSITFMLLDFMLPEGPINRLQASDFVNRGNTVGLTALHLAVWARRSGIMQVLLQHDADISVRSGVQLQPDILLPCTAGSTPLHLAAARGSVEICKLLLKTHYERVVEPLLLDPSSAESIAAASVATASDPRMQINEAMQMPYQIAQRMGYTPLAMMLRPTISLTRLFGEMERHVPRIYGAPSLKSLATEAVNRKLEATLKELMQKESEASSNRRRRLSELVISAAVDDTPPLHRALSTSLMATAPRSSSRSPMAVTPSMISPLQPVTPGIEHPPSFYRSSSREIGSIESPMIARAASRAIEAFSLPGMVQEDINEERLSGMQGEAMPTQQTDLNLAVSVCSVATTDDEVLVLSPRTPSAAPPAPPANLVPIEEGGTCYQPTGNDSRQPSLEDASHSALDASTPAGKLGSESNDCDMVQIENTAVLAMDVVNSQNQEAQDDECGVCLECVPGLIVEPCNHQLCGGCALKICTSDIKKPSLCPFCRTLIRNFGPLKA